MGILNLTPDSFSDGGRFLNPAAALQQAADMIAAGADILDLGAESTRPQADCVAAEDEKARLLAVLTKLRPATDRLISIDTTKPEVARACLEAGADIINDVSGLKDSGLEMATLVRKFQAGLVIMHRRGNPKTMQSLADYTDVTEDVLAELRGSLDIAQKADIDFRQIVLDPGIGFAKTAAQNLELLRSLSRFHELGLPLLLGVSRKAFIGEVTGKKVEDREFGTAGAVAWAVSQGVRIIRVHDVSKMSDVVKVVQAIQGEQYVRT